MKRLYVLAFILLLSACSSPQPTADPSARATEIANEVIGSFNDVEIPTLEAKPTSVEVTSTAEETATSEVEAPIQDGEHLDFGLNSQDFEKPDSLVLPDLVIDQEVEIVKRADGSEARLFFCVASELDVRKIQLTENVFSLAGSVCWYQEEGKDQWVYVPHTVSDGELIVSTGFKSKEYAPIYIDGTEPFWMSKYEVTGYEGRGHIFTISAEEIIPEFGEYGSLQGVGADELSKVFTDQHFAEFIRTMDPEVIGHVLMVAEAQFMNTANLNK